MSLGDRLIHARFCDSHRQRRDDWRDVVEGLRGAGKMVLDYVHPRRRRDPEVVDLPPSASPTYPGDELVVAPRWTWTHAIEIDAPPMRVWPWIAQIGAERGGFYSYQWLENLAGCDLRNAEPLHPEWQLREGDALVLHPRLPAVRVVAVEPGRSFVTHGVLQRTTITPRIEATWAFLLEPLAAERCRFTSRYRVATSSRLRVEPIVYEMDARMLRGVKQRAEAMPATG